jgi:hypothetical protein
MMNQIGLKVARFCNIPGDDGHRDLAQQGIGLGHSRTSQARFVLCDALENASDGWDTDHTKLLLQAWRQDQLTVPRQLPGHLGQTRREPFGTNVVEALTDNP